MKNQIKMEDPVENMHKQLLLKAERIVMDSIKPKGENEKVLLTIAVYHRLFDLLLSRQQMSFGKDMVGEAMQSMNSALGKLKGE